jgi:hypothetical protein
MPSLVTRAVPDAPADCDATDETALKELFA